MSAISIQHPLHLRAYLLRLKPFGENKIRFYV